MTNRARLIQTYVAGVSLVCAALISTAALAQYGCCLGGTATGANAWTTGNTTDQTPANIAGAAAPTPRDQVFTPVAEEPPAPLVPQLLANDDLLGRVNPVDLEHVLGDIQTDRCNLHGDRSLM